jgi:hypothetical protein
MKYANASIYWYNYLEWFKKQKLRIKRLKIMVLMVSVDDVAVSHKEKKMIPY